MSATRLALAFLLAALAAAPGRAWAQEEDDEKARRQPTRAESRVIEQILDLVEEIEELVATLPPHLRDEIRERLAAAAATEPEPAAADEASSDTGDDAAAAAVPATTETPAAPDEAAGTTKTVAPMATPTPTAEPVGCNALWLFDSDRDGVVGGPDRYWRHLYLWRDLDGDGAIGDDEIESAYERGVKAINVALDFFERRKEESAAGEIEIVRDRIVLDVAGDGIAGIVGGTGGAGTDDGALAVDATRLARGDGLVLLDGDGTALTGYQAFRPGLALRRADGTVLQLSCP